MATKIVISRVDIAANFTAANPILALGEMGWEQDTNRIKVGDGVTEWNSLPYRFEGVTDHGALTGLGDDDHPQYLNETRHDALPQDNPHNVNKGQVGLGSVDNTSDEDKPVSLAQQAALDLKYDISNPANYIDASGVPLAETDTTLSLLGNTLRYIGEDGTNQDVNLSTVVSNNETLTTLDLTGNILNYVDEAGVTTPIDLSIYLDDTNLARLVNGTLNPTTGIVTFTRDDSTTFTIDMSALLDNQNASEVPVTPTGNLTSTDTQAALEELQSEIDSIQSDQITQNTNISNNTTSINNNTTNITNNDSDISALQTEQTTQNTNINNNTTDITNLQTEQNTQNTNINNNTTDISILNSSQTTQDTAIALNTAKISADGSIDTHSDVDTSTAAPSIGDQLEWDGSNWVPKSIDNGFTIFPIWAEESGGLSNNNRQWSFGNGATGAINIPMAFDCEVFAMTFHAENSGTSVSIELMRDNGPVTSQTFTGASGVSNFTAIPFTAGQLLGFRTDIETGAYSDARICAWVRVKSSAAFPTPDRSVVNNSAVGFTATTFTTIPGLTTTVTISDTGIVDGMLIYSAKRSGAANATVNFRVVINGVAGLTFSDTLSTFDDTGAASFFVEGLPAGTYTVLAEAQTTEPITIDSCQLTAVGVEN